MTELTIGIIKSGVCALVDVGRGMNKGSAGKVFVQEFVIGFGFLGGLWIYAGVNPDTEILKAFSVIVPEMSGFFWWIGVMITIGSIVGAYFIGKWLGLLAVFLAFLGGIFLNHLGIWPLVGGIILGFFAPQLKSQI